MVNKNIQKIETIMGNKEVVQSVGLLVMIETIKKGILNDYKGKP